MKKSFIISGISLVFFILLIVAVKLVDVSAIGPCGTEIGLSGINKSFHDFTGVDFTMYDITNYLGIFAFIVGSVFAITGAVQWFKRKNIIKVDQEILLLGALYIVLGSVYVLFEKVIINYRPVLVDGCTEPEASFPSSHMMLAFVIFGSAFILIGKYFKNNKLKTILRIFFIILTLVLVLLRLFSGVHWLTDIIGGLLMSIFLLSLFAGFLKLINKKNNNKFTFEEYEMDTKIIRIDFDNEHGESSKTEKHLEIIKQQADKGYSYQGYFPVKMSPNGKIVTADIIFQKQ